MKAEELMKGNWVFSKRFQRPVQIVGIASHVLYYVDGVARTEKVEDISPIIIIPEILEKNGFEKQGYPGWLIYTKDYMIQWRNDYPNVLSIDSFTSKYGSFKRFNVNYLHEFQQALRLCEIEKEIIL